MRWALRYLAGAGSTGSSEFAPLSGLNARPQFVESDRLFDGHAPETDFRVSATLQPSWTVRWRLQTNAAYQ